ncbi:hypothetical protein M0R04_08135 [Candidatus Dojkabacteria bacterium]|jgi:hypothetical protein|nr:hypothetical protein [Candidatus Dojkabacteria bacterium]
MTSNSNYVDWSKIKNINDVLKMSENILYNNTDTYQSSDMLVMNPNLTDEEIKDAMWWKGYLNNLRGLMLITGEPRSGKGILMHLIAKKLNYYFGKLVITDTRPRPSFGTCVPFSFPMLIDQLERMDEVEKGIPKPIILKGLSRSDFEDEEMYKEYRELSDEEKYTEVCLKREFTDDCTFKEFNSRRNEFMTIPKIIPHVDENGKWISSRGEVFLRNAILLLDEFGSKYMPRSAPNLAEAQTLLKMFNFWGHLHTLMLGAGVSLDDFNPRAFEKASWHARCVLANNREYRYSDNPEDIIVIVYLSPIKYNPMSRSVQSSRQEEQRLLINGSEPRKMLGGLGIKDIYVSDNSQGMYISSKLKRRE